MSSGVTAHMVVKNEDQWVWFAINSVLPYVDTFLITDTGSTDDTIEIIKSIQSDKIFFNQTKVSSREDVTNVRQAQIDNTNTKWIWIVDGDEIYTGSGAKEITRAISNPKYNAVVVRRYDLLGDIYHKQDESVGSYNMFGESGHLLIRLINIDVLKGLTVKGGYPLESYYLGSGKCVNDLDKRDVYITKNYLYHAMYLRRSSLGSNLAMFNRSKYKIETGTVISDNIPEVFSLDRPPLVPNPRSKRGFGYELVANIVAPIKNIKRKIT
jgi:glycosyltransferase involved in cell wall biosynthesis